MPEDQQILSLADGIKGRSQGLKALLQCLWHSVDTDAPPNEAMPPQYSCKTDDLSPLWHQASPVVK